MICVFWGNTVFSQVFPNIQFNYLTEKEGLSDNDVSCITQDQQGFIWIGTLDGLNRYDGYRVKNFYYNPTNENSLVNNYVSCIVPVENNQLWIATREGVSVYNKQTGKFRNFRHNPDDTSSLDNDQNVNIFKGNSNDTWITTPNTVYFFDSSLHFKKINTGVQTFYNEENKKLKSYRRLTRDRQGNLWASKFGYVFLIDRKTMQATKKFGPFKGDIQTFYQDSSHQYWIGSFGGGLMRFDPVENKAIPVKMETPSTVVYSITEWKDSHQHLWLVLGEDQGIILLDPVSLKNKEYTFHLGYFSQQILSKNSVQEVFVDRQNILWVATDAGVCYARPSRQMFDLWNISSTSGILSTTISDWIYSLCEVSGGYWATRWRDAGLYFFNKEGILTETVNKIRTANGSYLLSGVLKPYYVCNFDDGSIWFTTDEYLVHYDLSSRKAQLYKPPDGNSLTGLRTITVANDHTWWIRTRNNGSNGIYIFDVVKKIFVKHFTNFPGCKNCVPPLLLTLYLTGKKELYLTAVGKGLFRYDSSADQFIPTFSFQGKDLVKHSNSFESITEDRKGILWITTLTGVFSFDPDSNKIIHDYAENPLIGGVEISGIVFDEQQNAWLNTEKGVFYILHATGEVRKLPNTEGLRNNSNGTFQLGTDHQIYCGIQGYILRLRPSELLKVSNQNIRIHFSEASIMGSPYFFHLTTSGQKEMVIQPSQNQFSVDYSIINYDGDNQYYYRLDGLMNGWQKNENGHLAFYNLSPGKYTLRVKGGNSFGELLSSEDRVVIVVEPHWWQTIWFWLLCGLVAVSATAYLLRRRIVLIRREAAFKQKILETEMTALRSQMNPHFIFNSLNSIENFMMQNEKRLAISYLNKFARLIRMILDSSRAELVPLTKDLEALKLYVDLEQLRFKNKFNFRLEVNPELLRDNYRVPPLLIQPYVENAIIHGIAHSEKKDLYVSVTVTLLDEYIQYIVLDNGIGRQMSGSYNQQNKPNHKSLGLAITSERIKIFNKENRANGQVTITDLFDNNHQPSGTEVDIFIKAV
ncbi:MAG: histidine kinase [Bacteroidetes bacterium]|nr:histidine kinase [Bacteroidota bacterium]MBS1631423.1 histidine kinase [Bacteroidota bacterium]